MTRSVRGRRSGPGRRDLGGGGAVQQEEGSLPAPGARPRGPAWCPSPTVPAAPPRPSPRRRRPPIPRGSPDDRQRQRHARGRRLGRAVHRDHRAPVVVQRRAVPGTSDATCPSGPMPSISTSNAGTGPWSSGRAARRSSVGVRRRPPPRRSCPCRRRRHRVHPRRVDGDVVQQGLAGAGLVALGVAGRQEPLVAPPDVHLAPVDGVAGAGRRRSPPGWRCRPAAGQTSWAGPWPAWRSTSRRSAGPPRPGRARRRRDGRRPGTLTGLLFAGGRRPAADRRGARPGLRTCRARREPLDRRPRRSRPGRAGAAPRRAAPTSRRFSATGRSGWPGRRQRGQPAVAAG